MFEMLLTTGNKLYLPWSGPGSKKVIQGNKELGYFGEVPESELFKAMDLFTSLRLPNGSFTNPNGQTWLKFIYKGRVLFTPKYHAGRSIRWAEVYAAGAVYGVRGPGPGPVPTAGAVDQVRLVNRLEKIDGKDKIWTLKIQLWSGANSFANPTADWASDQSEWDNIWPAFFRNKWENYNWQTMNLGDVNLRAMIRERTSDGANYATRGGDNAQQSKGVTALNNTGTGTVWRPVLELITGDKIAIPVYNVAAAVSNDALTSIIPAFSIDTPKPYLKAIQGLIGVTTYLRDLAPTFDTTTPAVYWEIPGAKYSGLATFENDAPLKPVANVSGYRSRLKAPETPITTVIPQVMANTSPVADRRLTTSLTNDAPLVPIIKVSAIRTQLKSPSVTLTGARPQVAWKTPGTVTLLPPTFEYVEPDDLASAFSNNKLNGFVI